ncbi:phosphatidylglycerophosphatase A family protein [Deminuibacter soli]|uniref:Phosphatidylglycerophosphatase A n=1 Tax=Deminuibacter soli TaxID=2291815 RepID=A0A3E1NI72_9BACT|nr:phosphatidylglycerophosphatase A [Deminuibacter soli]RFM27619.1 phosphatidylglycerophosphatase A [Deminuibacter soli]
MMRFSKLISTSLGIGYIGKGAGSVAAAVCCFAWYFIQIRGVSTPATFAAIVLLFFAGVWTASVVEREWGKDHNRVVIDEVQGMCVSLFLIPVSWKFVILGFILFRFFDITKPLFIRKAESLPAGWGVMMDDLLAGICSNVVLQLIVKSGLL